MTKAKLKNKTNAVYILIFLVIVLPFCSSKKSTEKNKQSQNNQIQKEAQLKKKQLIAAAPNKPIALSTKNGVLALNVETPHTLSDNLLQVNLTIKNIGYAEMNLDLSSSYLVCKNLDNEDSKYTLKTNKGENYHFTVHPGDSLKETLIFNVDSPSLPLYIYIVVDNDKIIPVKCQVIL